MKYPQMTLGLAVIGSAVAHYCSVVNANASSTPNVVLIFADDLGYGDLGCYGATKVQTPHIDRLAQEGRRFTDAHSASAVCTPSRYALMTGRYPARANGGVGVWGPAPIDSGLLIDPDRKTIADVFKSKGYATAALGKWHLGFGKGTNTWQEPLRPGPQDLGFDYYFGVPVVNSAPPYVYVENDRIVDGDPDDPLVYLGRGRHPTATPITPIPPEASQRTANRFSGAREAHRSYNDYTVGTVLAKKSVDWIIANQDEPFFLYLATTHIHHPFTPGKSFQGKSQASLYGDFIQELDWMVGQVTQCLDELGLDEETLVIFTSDNGGMLNLGGRNAVKAGHRINGDLLGFKFGAWEGGHRVPFIARWPGKIAPGTESDQLICNVDLLATFTAVTGQQPDPGGGTDSVNTLPALLGDPEEPMRRELLLAPKKRENLALRKGKWMYIPARGSGGFTGSKPKDHAWGGAPAVAFVGGVNSDIANGRIRQGAPPAQLYDLASDVNQTTNLYHDFPDVVRQMEATLKAYAAETSEVAMLKSARQAKREPMDTSRRARAVSGAPRAVSVESLLAEMIDRDSVARFPKSSFRLKQSSSYNRASKTPDKPKGWFTNRDFNSRPSDRNFLRIEEDGGQREWVLMDHNGPGAIVRSWMPWHNQKNNGTTATIRIYLDGASEPTLEGNMLGLFDGTGLIPYPFAHPSLRSAVSFFPIPYAKSCKVTTTEMPFFYQFTHREYEAGTSVETWNRDDFEGAQELIQETGETLLQPVATSAKETLSLRANLDAREARALRLPAGTAAVRELSVKLGSYADPKVTRQVVLKIEFDGEETVWCPVGDFFGTGIGLNPFTGWYRTVAADGTMSCRWVMPYQRSGKVSLVNLSDTDVDAELVVRTGDWTWDDRSMYFHAGWRGEYPVPTRPRSDWNYVKLKGRGVYVGDTLTVMNPVAKWWGEGDEKIWVDGEGFPSIFGTGTEDYYAYSWGGVSTDFYDHPFHAQPRSHRYNRLHRKLTKEKNTQGYSTETRTRSLDTMPFGTSLQLDMEVWHWEACEMGYGVGVYWYGCKDTRSNHKPQRAEVLSVPPAPSAEGSAPAQVSRTP